MRIWKQPDLVYIEGIEFKIGESVLNLKDDYIIKLVDFSNKISRIVHTYFTVVSEIFMPKYLRDEAPWPAGRFFIFYKVFEEWEVNPDPSLVLGQFEKIKDWRN